MAKDDKERAVKLPSNKHAHRQLKRQPGNFPNAVKNVEDLVPGVYMYFACRPGKNGRFTHTEELIKVLRAPEPGDSRVLVEWGNGTHLMDLIKLGLKPDFTGKWDHYNHLEPM